MTESQKAMLMVLCEQLRLANECAALSAQNGVYGQIHDAITALLTSVYGSELAWNARNRVDFGANDSWGEDYLQAIELASK